MLPKLTHIATVLPTLKTKQIKEIEQIWYDYISPKKGAARADRKTIHAPTAAGGLGLHHLKEFWQALKVSWIRKLNTSRSFWMQILATQTAMSTTTLSEIVYLTVDVLKKCKGTKNLLARNFQFLPKSMRELPSRAPRTKAAPINKWQ